MLSLVTVFEYSKENRNFSHVWGRPQRLISNVDDDEETIESAPVPVTQSSAARCDARRISSDAFRDELSAVIMRNRDRALLRTTIPSRVSSVTVKWMHEGTYRRFTLSYDDECDAYQALIDELSRFKSNFNGRLEWNGNNSSTETVYFQEEITSQQCWLSTKIYLWLLCTVIWN